MNAIDSLMTVATAYAESEGVGATTVSWRVFGDSKKLAALAAGKDIQVRRLEMAMAWFSAHWPAETAWPSGIARPATPVALPANDRHEKPSEAVR